MASTLLRRQLARVPQRLAASSNTPSIVARRTLSTTPTVLQAEQVPRTSSGKTVYDAHVVEDLHGMHASEILVETGTRQDAQMRHFTGACCSVLLGSALLTRPGLAFVHSQLRVCTPEH